MSAAPKKLKAVTLAKLRALNACTNQVELFQRTFGRSAKVTPANLTKAVKAGFPLRWLVLAVFGYDALREAVDRFENRGLEHGADESTCPVCAPALRAVLLKAAR